MSDQPLTVGALAGALATFHSKVLLPDIQRIVGDAVGASEGRLRNEMQAFHDSILTRLDRLETEYEAIKVGLARVEGRLDKIEERLGRLEKGLDSLERSVGQADAAVSDLRARVDLLHDQVRTIQQRLGG